MRGRGAGLLGNPPLRTTSLPLADCQPLPRAACPDQSRGCSPRSGCVPQAAVGWSSSAFVWELPLCKGTPGSQCDGTAPPPPLYLETHPLVLYPSHPSFRSSLHPQSHCWSCVSLQKLSTLRTLYDFCCGCSVHLSYPSSQKRNFLTTSSSSSLLPPWSWPHPSQPAAPSFLHRNFGFEMRKMRTGSCHRCCSLLG